jgi:hypothetical protein
MLTENETFILPGVCPEIDLSIMPRIKPADKSE